ncbi:hypothetical protein AGMMS50229_04450 [Campylobacterota bacterium]|nr:hypothetical protein AGMMS50229_04450 [Campylobacterota bacterium]
MSPDPYIAKIGLENIDNNEFLDYVLEHNQIKGLKREDVLYVGNAIDADMDGIVDRLRSCKLILTNDSIYRITSKATLMKEYSSFRFYSYIEGDIYVDKSGLWKAEIQTIKADYCNNRAVFDSCDALDLRFEFYDPKWYQLSSLRVCGGSYKLIPHRFNDIYKIKEIVDERVAYFLALEQAEQTNNADSNNSNTAEISE